MQPDTHHFMGHVMLAVWFEILTPCFLEKKASILLVISLVSLCGNALKKTLDFEYSFVLQ